MTATAIMPSPSASHCGHARRATSGVASGARSGCRFRRSPRRPVSLTRRAASAGTATAALCDAEPLSATPSKEPFVSAQGTTGSAMGSARRAGDSDALENLARVGLIAFGVVHLLVAWLALQLAWGGGSGESADQSGAMATLAESPVGKPLLWVIAIGLIALAVWQAAEVLRWRSGWSASGKTRTKALRKSGNAAGQGGRLRRAGGAGHPLRHRQRPVQLRSSSSRRRPASSAGPAASSWSAPPGSSSSASAPGTSGRASTSTSSSRSTPPRPRRRRLRLVTRLGQVGFPGKGDRAGRRRRRCWSGPRSPSTRRRPRVSTARCARSSTLPFGRILLTLVALGIAAFGAFCFVRARYPERT